MNSTLIHCTDTATSRRRVTAITGIAAVHAAAGKTARPAPVYGKCWHCGSVEVRLDVATGTTDLSGIGESSAYATGYGCEVCS